MKQLLIFEKYFLRLIKRECQINKSKVLKKIEQYSTANKNIESKGLKNVTVKN